MKIVNNRNLKERDLNADKNFNLYNLCVFLVIILSPLAYKILPKGYAYIQLFEKLSIPILIALYSCFWLKFTNAIEKLKGLIVLKSVKIENIKKHIQMVSIDELKRNENEINEFEISLRENKLYLKFVNKSLMYFAIITVAVEIISLIVENISYL